MLTADPPIAATLNFEGYWRDKKRTGIPAAAGLYCVYTCIYSGKKQACSPQKLLYIGAALDVRAALEAPAERDAWESHIDTGEELCYSFAALEPSRLEHCLTALVRRHKPPESPPPASPAATVPAAYVLTGAAGFLAKSFTA